jgi:hypothetical protein
VEQRLAQAGAGGNQGHVAAPERFSFLEHVHFRLLEHRHRVRHGLKIVQQVHAPQVEGLLDLSRVHEPWDVGELHLVADDRSRRTKASRLDGRARNRFLLHEFRDHRRQTIEVQRGEGADHNRAGTCRRRIEKSEQRLGPPDVGG